MLLVAISIGFGCMKSDEEISYYDRNGDGKVDLGIHHYRGTYDADWSLEDTNYSGRFEMKTKYGVGVIKSIVDLPVPKGVRIEPMK